MPDITSVTVTFGHGIKREEYGPVKKAEVSITASIAEGEMGEHILATVSAMAIARVAAMLDAPKPTATISQEETAASVGEPPARRTRGPNKKKEDASSAETPAAAALTEESTADVKPIEPAADEWEAGADVIEITDQEILSATSKRAGELGAREPIIKLIATFATRTEGTPFKVQEIPQTQRKDYLDKLAALTA